jgi:hypothetical protein
MPGAVEQDDRGGQQNSDFKHFGQNKIRTNMTTQYSWPCFFPG